MQERMILLRFLAVPLRHKLVGAGIAVAIWSGFFVWSRHASTLHRPAAVLSFDEGAARQVAPGIVDAHTNEPAVVLAQSLLSDEAVSRLARQAGAPSADNINAAKFHSHLEMAQPSPNLLRVSYNDPDRRVAAAASNAIADMLLAWAPSPEAAPETPGVSAQNAPVAAPPADQSHRQSSLHWRSQPLRELEAQLATTDEKLAALKTAPPQEVQAAPQENAAAAPPTSDANDQRRALELQLIAAQKKLDDLRVRYTDAYPDVETTKDDIAELSQKLASLPPATSEAEQPASETLHAGEDATVRLNRERDRLMQAIAAEKWHEAKLRKQAGLIHSSVAAQGAPSYLPQHVPASLAPSAAQVLHNPFALVQLAREADTGHSGNAPVWYGTLAGVLCGLLYLAGAGWRYRRNESPAPVPQEQVQDNARVRAGQGTPYPDSSIRSDDRWETEVRKALSLTTLGRDDKAFVAPDQKPAVSGPQQLQVRPEPHEQFRFEPLSVLRGDGDAMDSDTWVAHAEEARSALARHDVETAVNEMKLAIIAAPEKLRIQLSKIAMQMNKMVDTDK